MLSTRSHSTSGATSARRISGGQINAPIELCAGRPISGDPGGGVCDSGYAERSGGIWAFAEAANSRERKPIRTSRRCIARKVARRPKPKVCRPSRSIKALLDGTDDPIACMGPADRRIPVGPGRWRNESSMAAFYKAVAYPKHSNDATRECVTTVAARRFSSRCGWDEMSQYGEVSMKEHCLCLSAWPRGWLRHPQGTVGSLKGKRRPSDEGRRRPGKKHERNWSQRDCRSEEGKKPIFSAPSTTSRTAWASGKADLKRMEAKLPRRWKTSSAPISAESKTFRDLEGVQAMMDAGKCRSKCATVTMLVKLPDNILFDPGKTELKKGRPGKPSGRSRASSAASRVASSRSPATRQRPNGQKLSVLSRTGSCRRSERAHRAGSDGPRKAWMPSGCRLRVTLMCCQWRQTTPMMASAKTAASKSCSSRTSKTCPASTKNNSTARSFTATTPVCEPSATSSGRRRKSPGTTTAGR